MRQSLRLRPNLTLPLRTHPRSLTQPPLSSTSPSTGTTTSTTIVPRRASSGPVQYDPPTGNLFNVPPGEKYKKEGWENIWFYGYWGSLVVAAVLYSFKPDDSIQTWALEEARRRLEAEGILQDPDGLTTPPQQKKAKDGTVEKTS